MLFLQAGRELRELQIASSGADHPDLARTHNNLSEGIRRLMRVAPVAFQCAKPGNPGGLGPGLFQAGVGDDPFPPLEWASVQLAVTAEHTERRHYQRIRARYAGL